MYSHRNAVKVIWFLFCFSEILCAQELRTAFCYDPSATGFSRDARIQIGKSLNRVAQALDPSFYVSLKFRACTKLPKLSCYGSPEAVFCREEAFSRISYLAAIVAAEEAMLHRHESARQRLHTKRKLSWTNAYRLASALIYEPPDPIDATVKYVLKSSQLSQNELASLLQLSLDIHQFERVSQKDHQLPDSAFLKTGVILYRAILDYAAAFFFGHELHHFFSNKCSDPEPPKVDQNNTWNVLAKLQDSGQYFKRVRKEKTELGADRCALRTLERIDTHIAKIFSQPLLLTRARRAAVEVMAGPLLLGLRGFSPEMLNKGKKPQLFVVDGYLYPQSRLVAVTATLRSREANHPWAVKICGELAHALATIMQDAFKNNPTSNGIIPDEFLAELPTGVVKAWQGNSWTPQAFLCTPE